MLEIYIYITNFPTKETFHQRKNQWIQRGKFYKDAGIRAKCTPCSDFEHLQIQHYFTFSTLDLP